MELADAQFITDLRQRMALNQPVERDEYRRLLEIVRSGRQGVKDKADRGRAKASANAPAMTDDDLKSLFS